MAEKPQPPQQTKKSPLGTIMDDLISLLGKQAAAPPQPVGEKTEGNKIFKTTFGTIMFAHKLQRAINEEKKSKIIKLFTNPRDDPNDPYKPNSRIETQVNIELPYRQPLTEDSANMIHEIAANYDYCVPLDVIEAYKPNAFISHESQLQLNRLPTWLRFLILLKYDLVHERYGHHAHHFIRLLANRVDTKRSVNMDLHANNNDDQNDDDMADEEIKQRYGLNIITEEALVDQQRKGDIVNSDLFKLKYALWKWKLPRTLEQDWAPANIHRAATTLRRAILTQASPADLAIVAEDDKIARDELSANSYNVDDDEDNETNEVYGKPKWDDMISDSAAFKEEVAIIVDHDLKRIPPGLTRAEREEEERLAKQVEKTGSKKDKAAKLEEEPAAATNTGSTTKTKTIWQKIKTNELIKLRKEKKKRKVNLVDRALYRRYSRTWYKNCPQEPIASAKRLPHHYRVDESFHAYIVALVGSQVFKLFIMFVIIANALILAFETEKNEDSSVTFSQVIEIIDNLFLSVYLVEFILKVYAHPYRYWTSGFNVFDFCILMVSLIKAALDWLDVAEISYLKVLVIVRALRILRGISMSVQIQVLITALVETLKTHVLSVLILLFLLMYITSILAYYLFGDIAGLEDPWSNIIKGMLRLFTFVTMDGWTDTTDRFEEIGMVHQGRIFGLICVLLGNFLVSNIFIAIIIMQISEATEAFRSKQRDEREEIISKKKEIVFRRQKLDMRQLLAKQNLTINADFYYLGSQFIRLLRHDDLVDMNDTTFSPLWMDAFHKSIHRCHHTANLLMNLHRQMADNFLELYQINNEDQYIVKPIRRGRYNRYMKMKSRLQLLRQEFFRNNYDPHTAPESLRLRLPPKGSSDISIANKPSKQMVPETQPKIPKMSMFGSFFSSKK